MSYYNSDAPSAIEQAIGKCSKHPALIATNSPTAKATDPSQSSENWEYILDVCDKVNDDPTDGPRQAIEMVISNLTDPNPKKQTYTLVLLSSLAQNCGPLMHKQIASKTLTGQLLELGTDSSASKAVRTQVFDVMETLSREFRSDPSLRQVEETFNRLKLTDPSVIPPEIPQKHQITEEDRRREEEELQRVLTLSLEESQEDPRYYPQAASSSAQSQPFRQTQQQVAQPTSQQNFFNQSAQTQPIQTQKQSQPQKDLLSDDIEPTPQSATGKTASTVNRVRAIYDLTSEEPGELTFHRGDIITVIESVYRDWWKGSLRGEIGIFPLNYVTPIPDATPQDLAQDARDEQAVYAEARNIEKILTMLNAAEKQNPPPKIAENEELQNLYNSTQAIRPKLVKLIEKLTQKREDLIDLDKKFMSARRSYDNLIDGSLPHAQQAQTPHSSSNPFNRNPQAQPQVQMQPTGFSSQSPDQPNAQPNVTQAPQQGFHSPYNNAATLQATPTGYGFQGAVPNSTGYSNVQANPNQQSSSSPGRQQGFNSHQQNSSTSPVPEYSQVSSNPAPSQPQWNQSTGSQGNSPYQGNYPQQGQNQVPLTTGATGNPQSSYPGQSKYPVQLQYGQVQPGGAGSSQGRPQHQSQGGQPQFIGGFTEVSRPPHMQAQNQQNPQQQGTYKTEDDNAASFIIPAGTGMDDSSFPSSNPRRNQYR